jgi:hypothetical protein
MPKGIWIPPDIYQLKVTLLYTRPPIWRRLLVPSGFALEDLHSVIQAAMGWDDSHLHEFRIGQKRFGKSNPGDRLMGMDPIGSERTGAPLHGARQSQSQGHVHLRLRRQLGACDCR